jgi:parallel beta-helix repeat protein
VSAAASGDRIDVCAAGFSEQVVIDKSLTIVGAGQGKTKLLAPSPLTGTQDIVTITGSGVAVDLSGFTISDLGLANDCSGLLSGVFVRDGADATIHDNTFTAIRNDPLDGCQKGTGIRVGRAALSTSGTATITNNTISDYQKTGIVVDGAGSSATITDNTVTGVGKTGVIAQNGIQISRGADAKVSGNTVSGDSYTQGEATGILLYGDLGTVSVSGNDLSDDDSGIAAASVTPKGNVTISGNTISGAGIGITLGATVDTIVENNTVKGAGSFGLQAEDDAKGNTFDGNASSGAGTFDCRDESTGAKTAQTANTWTGDTGDTSSPAGICAKAEAPPTTTTTPPETTTQPGPTTPPPGPVEVDPPQVIVLPPIPGTPDASESPEPITPQPPPVKPAAPLQPPQPKGGVASAGADEIVTRMHQAKLRNCLITVSWHGPKQIVIARGLAHAPAGGSGLLIVRVGVQPQGQKLLETHFGGVVVDVRAACTTTTNTLRRKTKLARAVLKLEHVVTTPGSWVPDRAVLTPTGKQFVAQLRKRMIDVKRLRCDGYAAQYPPSPVDARTLSAQRASLLCSELRRSGNTVAPHLIAHGNSHPVASNATEAGRAANRRVAVTFLHLVASRTTGV